MTSDSRTRRRWGARAARRKRRTAWKVVGLIALLAAAIAASYFLNLNIRHRTPEDALESTLFYWGTFVGVMIVLRLSTFAYKAWDFRRRENRAMHRDG